MVHRNRRRYVIVHILSPDNVGKGLLIKLLRDRTRDLPKEQFDIVKPWLVYFHGGWAIIRTTHRGSDMLLSMLEDLNGTELKEGALRFRMVATSGTLRSAFLKHIPEAVRLAHHYREERERT